MRESRTGPADTSTLRAEGQPLTLMGHGPQDERVFAAIFERVYTLAVAALTAVFGVDAIEFANIAVVELLPIYRAMTEWPLLEEMVAQLVHVAKNFHKRGWRERWREESLDVDNRLEGIDSGARSASEAVEDAELKNFVLDRIDRMPRRMRQAMRMRVEDGMEVEEIAKVLNTGVRNARKLIDEGAARLLADLNDYQEKPGRVWRGRRKGGLE